MPVRVWGWLEAFSFLQTVPSHGTIGFGSASWTSPDQTGAGFGLGGSSLEGSGSVRTSLGGPARPVLSVAVP